jgi:hypothetical protein
MRRSGWDWRPPRWPCTATAELKPGRILSHIRLVAGLADFPLRIVTSKSCERDYDGPPQQPLNESE